MIYRTCGSSNLNMSRIGFGCMSLPPDESTSIPILKEAIDLGINYLDTADIYNDGINESIIGKAIKGIRDKVIVASKAGNQRRPDGGLDWNPSKQYILSCVEGSLKRLQTDYIDLYQLHGGTINDNINESIEAFELLKQQGKIRNYGISSIRPNVIREYIQRSSIVSVMTQYSLLDRRPEEVTLNMLRDHNIGVLVRGSVAQGLLINKPAKAYLGLSADDVARAADAVRKISSENRTPTHIAIKYVMQHPSVTSVVVGMRTKEQLHDALRATETPDLTPEEMELLKNASPAARYTEHR